MTQAEAQARRADKQPAAVQSANPYPLCIHRSAKPAGKIKCSCANAPVVYTCAHPWVISGYCCPTLPKQPADGPIVLHDGTRIVPKDTRRSMFIPMPLRSDETPRPWDAVTCESCPNRTEPPPHIAAILSLGISGDFDPETGHADVLHVVPRGGCALVETPGRRSVQMDSTQDIGKHLQATACKIVIMYGTGCGRAMLEKITSNNPDVFVWCPDQHQQISEMQDRVLLGLHHDLEKLVQESRRTAYAEAFKRIVR